LKLPGSAAVTTLAVLAIASWWLAHRGRTDSGEVAPSVATDAGYYMNDATLEQIDASGRVALRVRADRAQQAEEHGPTRLTALRVDYYPSADRAWRATSRSGSLPAGARALQLEGDVRLRAVTAGRASGAVVRTEHLKLDFDRSLATTTDMVNIEFTPHVLTARGLRADLKHETLQLESSVHGIFTR
jgi:LPS export ABC transporter protein LptC